MAGAAQLEEVLKHAAGAPARSPREAPFRRRNRGARPSLLRTNEVEPHVSKSSNKVKDQLSWMDGNFACSRKQGRRGVRVNMITMYVQLQRAPWIK